MSRLHSPLQRLRNACLSCSLLAVGFASSGLSAQEVQPGLWEVNTRLKMPGNPELEARMAQAQEQLKNLPPSVREQMEKTLGVTLGKSGPGSTTVRLCLTPEQAKRPLDHGDQGNGCTWRQTRQSGNTISGQISCPPPSGSGEFTTTLHSKEHYSTVGAIDSQQGRMEISSEARRLGADCGSIKPLLD